MNSAMLLSQLLCVTEGKDFHTIILPHLKSCWWPCMESFSISISRQEYHGSSWDFSLSAALLRKAVYEIMPDSPPCPGFQLLCVGSTGDSLWLCWGGSTVSWILFKNPNKINKHTSKKNGSDNLKGRLILLKTYRLINIAGLGVMLVPHKTKKNPCSRQGSLCHCPGSCCLFHLISQSQSFGLCYHSWSLIKTWQRIQEAPWKCLKFEVQRVKKHKQYLSNRTVDSICKMPIFCL